LQKEKKILLIDDVRNIERCSRIARTYFEGIILLQLCKWDELLLDHDLGPCSVYKEREYTGYDIMCWLEEFPEYLPKKISCVSANPVGRRRIEQVIQKLYETS
jgi:hypothetical protein